MVFASVMVFVVVVVTVRVCFVVQSPSQQFAYSLVGISGDSRVKLDAQFRKCLLHSRADPSANDCVDSVSLQVGRKCAVTVSVRAYDFGMSDSLPVGVVEFELLSLAEMLEDICSVKRCCDSQDIYSPSKVRASSMINLVSINYVLLRQLHVFPCRCRSRQVRESLLPCVPDSKSR